MKVNRVSEKFWNNKDNIEWFKKRPMSPYWIDFFSHIPSITNKRVLDLGCGTGRNSEMLINLGYNVYCCDRYATMIKETKNLLKKMKLSRQFINGHVSIQSMDRLSFKPDFFDIVLSHGVYHNAFTEEEFKKSIQESARVLKNSGFLCYNIFSSNILPDLSLSPQKNHTYTTKEGLPIILFSKKEFIEIAEALKLKNYIEPVEYESNVSTGKRSVVRGVLIKKLNSKN